MGEAATQGGSGAAVGSDARFVIYREFLGGDERKVQAQSADSDSGGGARDLRFRGQEMRDAWHNMLPGSRQVFRRRGGAPQQLEQRYGTLTYPDPQTGTDGTAELQLEPPTDVRPEEVRITRAHEVPPLRDYPQVEGRLLLLFIRDGAGVIRPSFVTEDELRAGAMPGEIATPILECIQRTRGNRAVQGYIDLQGNRNYCHA